MIRNLLHSLTNAGVATIVILVLSVIHQIINMILF